MKKPIMCIVGEHNGFDYKYIRTAYALDVKLEFKTDLSQKLWIKLIEGQLTNKEIEQFELTGAF